MRLPCVIPSQDIDRDMKWYKEYVGFEEVYKDNLYAVIRRGHLYIHLQWHADNEDDPLLGGSVIKIFVRDIDTVFQEFVERTTIKSDVLRMQTPWNTSEFGFYDLNNNVVFVEKLKHL